MPTAGLLLQADETAGPPRIVFSFRYLKREARAFIMQPRDFFSVVVSLSAAT